jgi:hypothetical protein
MWIDLIPLKTKEATEVAAALVLYILRYGTPVLLWGGRDTELNNTCRAKPLQLRCRSQ